MNNQMVKHGGRHATKLVWIITLLGLGAGIVMLGIVYWTIDVIHTERETLDEFQAALTRMVTTLDTHLAQGRFDIDQLLSSDKRYTGSGEWVDSLAELTSGDALSLVTGNADIRRALDQLGAQVSDLRELRVACAKWNERAAQLSAVLPDIRQKMETSLNRLGVAIIGIEGRQRLARAIQIRRYRQSSGGRANALAHEIIGSMGRGSEMATIKTELADLALLCERLVNEDHVDDLADLKDNKFKATLDRLRRGIDLLGRAPVENTKNPVTLLGILSTNLFGQGFKVDDIHQTIIPGQDGLYLTVRQKLQLEGQRDELHRRNDRLLTAVSGARQQLVGTAEDLANQTARSAEDALARSWKTMLTIWLVSFSVFLILSVKISQTVWRQIKAIESTNLSLTAEIYERQKVEAALRQSEEALRTAKDELEMRVEERTRELKQANEQLAKEITERKKAEAKLRRRGEELANALKTTRKARRMAEAERDKSGKMLEQVTESKRRLEILISDATAREQRMVDLKREVNTHLERMGRAIKYSAPRKVDAFLAR